MAHVDVEIRIFKHEAGRYPVEITVDGEGEPGRGYLDPATQPPSPAGAFFADPAYGQALFDWFFADARLKNTWAKLRGAHPLRRIRLRIDDDASELHTVPWEALCEPPAGQGPALHLAAATATPFSRYLAVDSPLTPPSAGRPIRVLVAVPEPTDFETEVLRRHPGMALIDAQAEFASFQLALRPYVDSGQVELVLLDAPCSLARIGEELSNGFHGLHLICHGWFDKESGQAALLLADAGNLTARVPDDAIASALGQQWANAEDIGHTPLRWVFLATCESATRSSADAFRGLAPKLVRAGAPAVVAMQDQVGDKTARQFAVAFYERLLRHGQVDLAANQARQAIMAAKLPGAVIPVVFLRMKEGRLLEPDPNWIALCEALERLQAGDTYAYVSDDRGDYLRLPVEAVPFSKDQNYQETTATPNDPTAGIPFLDAVRETRMEPSCRLILVVGDYGSNITTQLKRFAWLEVRESWRRCQSLVEPRADLSELDQPSDPVASADSLNLPVFATLGELRHGRAKLPADPVLGLVVHKLANSGDPDLPWPKLTAATLEDLFKQSAVKLLLVIDDDDMLTAREQQEYYAKIVEFVRKRCDSGHKVILAVRPAALRPGGPFSTIDFRALGVQRMERRKIRHFLQAQPPESRWARTLLDRIDRSAYFDLVSVPWFLYKLVEQARNGRYARSRTDVVEMIFDAALDRVVDEFSGAGQVQHQGLEENIRQIVYELAWHLQSTHADAMPLASVLAAIERHRGRRAYGVEPLYEALVARKVLAHKGSDEVRFAYRGIQSYCSAKAILQQPDSVRALDDVVASMGRLTRLRWWEDTLVFACGLMSDQPGLLDEFLRLIIYGMDPRDNEQVFLAARCIAESIQASLPTTQDGKRPVRSHLNKMAKAITAALTWRLDGRYESRSAERTRAAELLGQITYPPRVRRLVDVAYRKTHWDRHAARAFDHSDVRMAAVVGLLRLTPSDRATLLKSLDRQDVLITMLDQWTNGQVDELIATLRSNHNVAAQSIAAMALGDLYGRLVLSDSQEANAKASQALEALTAKFQDDTTDDDTMWALAYALAMIDLPTVKRAMVEGGLWTGVGLQAAASPLPDERLTAFFQEWNRRVPQQKFLAYLIGLAQWKDSPAVQFLHEQCLRLNTDRMTLAAVAVESLSRVGNPTQDVHLLEAIATDRWDTVLGLEHVSDIDRQYLQRKAIDALASLGDLASIERLQQRARSSNWSPELERALYLTTEKIFWRLRWDHEV